MGSRRRLPHPAAAVALAVAALTAAPMSASASPPADGGERADRRALATAPPARGAERSFPKRAAATRRRGVRRVAGLRVALRRDVPNLRQVRRELGRPDDLDRDDTVCSATWDGGLQLDFVTFGLTRPCGRRALQAATLTGRGWTVRVGPTIYRIGQPRSVIPPGAKRIRVWGGGGYELATMPFAGTDDATTVLAHVGRRERIDRFYLWIGGAGD